MTGISANMEFCDYLSVSVFNQICEYVTESAYGTETFEM